MENFGSLFGTVSSVVNSAATENFASFQGTDLLRYHLLDRGVHLLRGGGYLSTAHTDEDIDYIIQAVKDSVKELREGGLLPSNPTKLAKT